MCVIQPAVCSCRVPLAFIAHVCGPTRRVLMPRASYLTAHTCAPPCRVLSPCASVISSLLTCVIRHASLHRSCICYTMPYARAVCLVPSPLRHASHLPERSCHMLRALGALPVAPCRRLAASPPVVHGAYEPRCCSALRAALRVPFVCPLARLMRLAVALSRSVPRRLGLAVWCLSVSLPPLEPSHRRCMCCCHAGSRSPPPRHLALAAASARTSASGSNASRSPDRAARVPARMPARTPTCTPAVASVLRSRVAHGIAHAGSRGRELMRPYGARPVPTCPLLAAVSAGRYSCGPQLPPLCRLSSLCAGEATAARPRPRSRSWRHVAPRRPSAPASRPRAPGSRSPRGDVFPAARSRPDGLNSAAPSVQWSRFRLAVIKGNCCCQRCWQLSCVYM